MCSHTSGFGSQDHFVKLMMSQLCEWSLAASDVDSAFLNAPIDESKGLIFAQAPRLATQASTVWPQRFTEITWQTHLTQVLQKMNLSQMRSDPCAVTGRDSSRSINIIVMAYAIHRQPGCLRRVIFSAEILSGDPKGVQPQAR